jgi:hypothetical protein
MNINESLTQTSNIFLKESGIGSSAITSAADVLLPRC